MNPARSTVRRTFLRSHRVADTLLALNNVCIAGAQCAEVQNAPTAKQAYNDLSASTSAALLTQASRSSFLSVLAAACKALPVNLDACAGALRIYESAVNRVSGGRATIIHKAGLPSRDQKIPPSALGVVTDVTQKLGKDPSTAIVNWPKVPRATGYAIQVNPTPGNPAGPWTALGSGSSRRRIVTGPAPESQIMVQIAALRGDGTQSAWSAPVLVSTR
jgi:hypothetical protein